MKTSLLLLYIFEWLQKEGMVAVPHLRDQSVQNQKQCIHQLFGLTA
ncbi:hypothetical protein [Bacillus cereus]|uniref:Transposase n=1 Tax=Bacillus cereus TaxID=1396 RepID=A0AAW5L7X8_BACCE|nr:hypothetical protein [Bacillus cereus]MCQ6288449.1 hypothetical protein [Bacillus cereus]MCQ6317575.1 hypothetical protein [Bacillus cereus]MCQ6328549.1 hypothetical protein [Bacillus cereus]MCQ6385544.1 hypothetical protein [Bacillus cereus]